MKEHEKEHLRAYQKELTKEIERSKKARNEMMAIETDLETQILSINMMLQDSDE